MAEKGFRSFLDDLDAAGELKRITKPVDCRQLSALGEQADQATMFENIEGYPGWRVATALVSTRKRLAVAMGCTENRVAFEFEAKSARPIDPVTVENAPCQEVVMEGDDVDLTSIPLPLMHLFDGGPYISGTFAVSQCWLLPADVSDAEGDRYRFGLAIGHAVLLSARPR